MRFLKRVSPIVGVLVAAAVVSGCQKRDAGGDDETTSAAASTAAGAAGSATSHPGDAVAQIAWFQGEVPAAFEKAHAENKPVFLYWGAEWCPYCKDLQANVFSRRDFVAKSRLFVPVYLDGDSAGAQKWGDEFHISGYPTVLVLKPDRTELARIAGGMDMNQYAEVLDLVLGDVKPVNELLVSAQNAKTLSADDCRRLAYNGWNLDEATGRDADRIAAGLQKASALCPGEARLERARLIVIAASAAADAQSKVLESGKPASALLKQLTNDVQAVLADLELAVSIADALQYLDKDYFSAFKRINPDAVAQLEERWNGVMDAVAADSRYTAGDRLAAVRSKLIASKALSADGEVPKPLAQEARKRVDEALAQKHDAMTRAGVVNAAINTLNELDAYEAAYRAAEAQMKVSKTPYYYMADLADLDEKLGRKEEAVAWLEKAYKESKGPATRFQWGTAYVRGLVRMKPEDEKKIREAALEVLGELDGPERIYRRTKARLDKLDESLREWNAKGVHEKAIAAIRSRMSEICGKIPKDETSAKQSCEGFLAVRTV